jgi:hypothetical protein
MDISIEQTDMRSCSDRRKYPTPVISRFTLYGGRRKIVRREADKKKHLFVDLYSTRLLIALLFVLGLSCLDAFLTLELIENGRVVEANPLMAFLLEYGVQPFTIIKFTVTAAALIVLCLFKNVNITRICLPLAIKVYIAVIIYEIYLYIV